MGYDVGACGVYGVVPEGPFFDRLVKLYDEEYERRTREPDDPDEEWEEPSVDNDFREDVMRDVLDEYPDLREELWAQYHAPDDAKLYLTWDSDEDQPGRQATFADTWVLGYWMYNLPFDRALPEVFRKQSQMWTWCWGG